MPNYPSSHSPAYRQPLRGILIGGMIAGTLDIAYAVVSALLRGRGAAVPIQAVASGLLGAPAFDGGGATVALGLLLHFFIALSAAAAYFLASRWIGWLRREVLIPGCLFGFLVFLTMNFVVLPLSAVPFHLSYPPLTLFIGFVSHTLFVGWPIAWAIRRQWRQRPA